MASLLVLPLPCENVSRDAGARRAPAFEHQWSVFFDGAAVPDDDVPRRTGQGRPVLFDGLNPERLSSRRRPSASALVASRRPPSMRRERVVFDVPIGAHQAVQHPLAESLVGLEGAWALIERGRAAVRRRRAGGPRVEHGEDRRLRRRLAAADRALQVFGGSGYTDETKMLQRFTYMRLLRSIPVARELALNHVATAGLGLPRSY